MSIRAETSPSNLATKPGQYWRFPVDNSRYRRCELGKRFEGILPFRLNNKPVVSVITVCYNASKYIDRAISSVASQDYQNIEHIVIDGNSTDNTHSVIMNHINQIDYYLSEVDNGIYDAMNKGISLSTGEYIIFLNSDDWYEKNAISSLVEAVLFSGADLSCALANYVNDESSPGKQLRSMPFDDSSSLRMPLRHETLLVPAHIYYDIGLYDTSYSIIADRKWVALLHSKGYSVFELPKPLLNFLTTGISNTSKRTLKREQVRLLKETFPFLSAEDANEMFLGLQTGSNSILNFCSRMTNKTKLIRACQSLVYDRSRHSIKWTDDDHIKLSRLSEYTVSVIVPTHNAVRFLEPCIKSLLMQELSDIEIILIDDCSTDGTLKQLHRLKEQDSRIKVFSNSCNRGLGWTRNRGISLSRGRYIFHVDPDDTVPSHALKDLVFYAEKYGSDLVKGSFLHEQLIRNKPHKAVVKGLKKSDPHIVNISLCDHPELLRSTEGHWSYLYKSEFARQVQYPTNLKMGQDSIFIVNALVKANTISIINSVVYHYRSNTSSAMNTFSFPKVRDSIEWRRRAYFTLKVHGLREIGEHILFNYWSESLLELIIKWKDFNERIILLSRLKTAMDDASFSQRADNYDLKFRSTMDKIFSSREADSALLSVSTICTADHGGAGIGSLRRIKALRDINVDARLSVLFKTSQLDHVSTLKPRTECISGNHSLIMSNWRLKAVLTRDEEPCLMASELFSKTGSEVNFKDNLSSLTSSDILHLHWVSGVIDYSNIDVIADQAIVWTLADMNAFTGGCHYSEGCEQYKEECRNCPLINSDSDLPYRAWLIKKEAYSKLKNLTIICPSNWLADKVRQSSLLRVFKTVVIPNPAPLSEFQLVNKRVARLRLGLPINGKYILFGADSVSNKRKGGSILLESLKRFSKYSSAANVQILFFGDNPFEVPFPSHAFGKVSSSEQLSLIYSAADVFAFPSLEDNSPLTVMEALLCGTPVVGFPVGNVPELISDPFCGTIVKYNDAEDFASGLASILSEADNISTLRRSIKCRQVVKSLHDPLLSAHAHLNLYKSVLQSKTS